MKQIANAENAFKRFAADISGASILHSHDVEECERSMLELGVSQRFVQTSPGAFRGELAYSESSEGGLLSDRFSAALSVSLALPAGTAAFLVPRSRSGKFTVNGQHVSANHVVYLPGGKQVDVAVGELSGSDSILFSDDAVSNLFSTLSHTGLPSKVAIRSLGDDPASASGNLIASAISQGDCSDEEGLSAFVSQLTMALCPEADSNSSDTETSRQAVLARAVRHYLHDHFRERIRLSDLSSETGVTLRTVQRAFSTYFDTTISSYLQKVRLNAARTGLLHGAPGRTSVSRVAMESGFTHLGRFSNLYRDYYGEFPSETLTRVRVATEVRDNIG